MASQKQIEANRRNALKSTGPRTPAGKALASRNALRHGLRAQPEDLSPEDEQALDRLTRDFHRHLRPDGPRQTLQVRNLAVAAWRLDHLRRLEAAASDTPSPCHQRNPRHTHPENPPPLNLAPAIPHQRDRRHTTK